MNTTMSFRQVTFLLLFHCLLAGLMWWKFTVSSNPYFPPSVLSSSYLPDRVKALPIHLHRPVCQREDLANCPRPLVACKSDFRSSQPSYPLTACIIQKSMSTFLSAIMCYLHDPAAFRAANQSLGSQEWDGGFCKETIASVITADNITASVGEGTSLFTIVRDPIERFVSGYVHKCVPQPLHVRGIPRELHCHGCPTGNLTCFVERQHMRTLLYSNGFLKDTDLNYLDIHFFPQNWFCQFSKSLRDYKIIRYGGGGEKQTKMADELQSILKGAGVEAEHVEYIRNGLLTTRTSHATAGSAAVVEYRKRVYDSERIKKLLSRMYYYDYLLFGFTPPLPL